MRMALAYEIVVKGELDPVWASWFDGLGITPGDRETRLKGSLPDQAALLRVLNQLQRLGVTVMSVECLPAGSGSPTADH